MVIELLRGVSNLLGLMEKLKTLFDPQLIENASPSESMDHYERRLGYICREMLKYVLVIGDKRYDMLEIEVYLTAPKHGHPDPYCHGHPLQKKPGAWFFHHVAMSKGFRGGSRKGVDITLGNKEKDSAGGVLIRAILDQDSGKIIEGPSLVVDEILSTLRYKSIKELVETRWKERTGWCWDIESGFYLEPRHIDVENNNGKKQRRPTKRQKILDYNGDEHAVHASSRVGLGLTNREPSIETRLLFVGRPYRFVVKPWLLKKGRVWTIFGMLEESMSTAEIARLTGAKPSFIQRCKEEYDAGQKEAIITIRKCLKDKDILAGGADWKVRVMSAIRWWEQQQKQGICVEIPKL